MSLGPAAPTYDLGIHADDLIDSLQMTGAASIIGYVGAGKSTLSEVLAGELTDRYSAVFHQEATLWLRSTSASLADAPLEISVDPEVAGAIARLEQTRSSCWIVDDAEVLLAYATEDLLDSIRRKVAAGLFSAVLVRNRFVHEGTGWFRDREELLGVRQPGLKLVPLSGDHAIEVARAYYPGPEGAGRADWLVRLSGGIPRLMADLQPFAPVPPNVDVARGLLAYANRRRQELSLDRPLRKRLIEALGNRILPPPALLTTAAADELGVLLLAGMVHPDYTFRATPYRGDFWNLIAPVPPSVSVPTEAIAGALELAEIVRELGLSEALADALSLGEGGADRLSEVFSRIMACTVLAPGLSRPIEDVLAEYLGRQHIIRILKRRFDHVDDSLNRTELAAVLVAGAGQS
jgi:hypothetical protein